MAASATKASALKIDIRSLGGTVAGDTVIFMAKGLKMAAEVEKALGAEAVSAVRHAAKVEAYAAKPKEILSLIGPAGRLIVIGLGDKDEQARLDWVSLGGLACGKLIGREGGAILAAAPLAITPEQAADLALGLRLRAYRFDRYKVRSAEAKDGAPAGIALCHADAAALRKAVKHRDAVAAGVNLAPLPTPMLRQAQLVASLTQLRSEVHNRRWREIQVPQLRAPGPAAPLPPLLTSLDAAGEDLRRAQRQAARPRPHRFVLTPKN